jgi:hypothetical protein
MMRIVVALLLLLLFVPRVEAQTCSPTQESAAESATDALHSWQSIFAAYKRYGNCDDGAVAEGFSDDVVHHLATKWASLHQAQRLIAKDPLFKTFIVRHVDASADTDELDRVVHLATHECPRSAKLLCKQIARAASVR